MRVVTAALFVALLAGPAIAQEGLQPTQMLVGVDAKSSPQVTNASAFTVEVNGRKGPLQTWEPLASGDTQVALLIDDGLREAIGREMDSLKSFVRDLPPGVEVMIGFMQYGRVVSAEGFTTDHAQVAASLHLPQGVPGASASPYVCLSEFAKNWPGGESSSSSPGAAPRHKAKFVLMITDGVDPYNGSTSVLNQDSPYVKTAVADAQRAGVVVSAIYFSDAGIRGDSADNSGQSYLSQVADSTGGISYWEGIGNPVSFEPFLKQFRQSISEEYVAGFLAPTGRNPQRDLVRVKISVPHVKLHAPSDVLPGNRE